MEAAAPSASEMDRTPKPEDKFSFGLWTVGWQARDLFGEATRPVLAGAEAVHELAELGAYGITFHDDDLVPPGSSAAERDRIIAEFKEALADTGLVVPMVTTNLFSDPVFKDGGFTSNDRSVRRYALRKVMRNMDLAAELGAQTYVFWGGREGSEVDFAKDIRAALDRYREGIDLLAQYSIDKGYGLRFAIEPKPNEPRGDILLPSIGHALAFINELRARRHGRHQPRDRPRADGHRSTTRTASPRRCGRASSSTSTSTARRARATTRTWSSATATCCRPSPPSTCSRTAARTAARRTTARGTSTTSRCAPRTWTGVWESARANMELYLRLREKAQGFRADPEVQEALEAARVAELSQPTLNEGESYDDLLADRSSFEDYDIDRAREQSYGFARLQRLAIEHLLGTRGA